MVGEVVTGKVVYDLGFTYSGDSAISKFTKSIGKTSEEWVKGVGSKRMNFKKIIDVEELSKLGRKYREAFSLGKTSRQLEELGINIPWTKKNLGEFEKAYRKGYDDTLKKGIKTTRWFKMEMLGIMFFGMAMQRMFMGLLQPAMNAFGVMDLWGTMMMILFLPTIQALFPAFMAIFDTLTNMDPVLQKVLGGFTVLGAVVGTGLATYGQMSLGFTSLLKDLTNISPKLAGIITQFGLLRTVGLAIGIIATVFVISSTVDMFKKANITIGDRLYNGLGWAISGAFIGASYGRILGVPGMIAGALIGLGISVYLQIVDWIWKSSKPIPPLDMTDRTINSTGSMSGVGANGIYNYVEIVGNSTSEVKSSYENMGEGVYDSAIKIYDANKNIVNSSTESGKMVVKSFELVTDGLDIENIKINENLETWKKWQEAMTQSQQEESDKRKKMVQEERDLFGIGSSSQGEATRYGGGAAYAAIDRGKGSYEVETEGGEKVTRYFGDMIWRPGSPPIAISPQDTLVATKGGAGGGVNISYTINGGLSGKEEVERMIRNANAKLVNDIQRLVGA